MLIEHGADVNSIADGDLLPLVLAEGLPDSDAGRLPIIDLLLKKYVCQLSLFRESIFLSRYIILSHLLYSFSLLLKIRGARRNWRKESLPATSTVFKSFSGGNSAGCTGSANKPATRGNMVSFRGFCGGVESSNIRSDLSITVCEGLQQDANRLRNTIPTECLEVLSDRATIPSSSHTEDCTDSLSACGEVRGDFSMLSTEASQSGGILVNQRDAWSDGQAQELFRAGEQVEETDRSSVLKAKAVRDGTRFCNLTISDFYPGEIPVELTEGPDSDSCSRHRIADDGAFIFSTH